MEKFKHKQSWEHALHSRFDCYTGDVVTEDDGWGHLQVRRFDRGTASGGSMGYQMCWVSEVILERRMWLLMSCLKVVFLKI